MKKHPILLLALTLGWLGTAQAQQPNGHFSMRYPQGMVQSDLDAFCRAQLPNLCEGTTFEITADQTDAQGLRNVTLQQYVGGVRANGKSLKLCLRGGKVLTFSGNVMTREQMSSAPAQTRAARSAAEIMRSAGLPVELADKAELVWETFDGQLRQAYRVLVGTNRTFIDAQTGQVLSRHSIIKHFDYPVKGTPVKSKGATYFWGEREFDGALLDDGRYTLFDYDRHLYTLDVSYEKIAANGYSVDTLFELFSAGIIADDLDEDDPQLAELLEFREVAINRMRECAEPFSNDAPVWANTPFDCCLDSLTTKFPAEYASNFIGRYATCQLECEDGSVLTTDTVKIERESVTLHLPETYTYGETETLHASFIAFDPEAGLTSSMRASIPKSASQAIVLTSRGKAIIAAHNYTKCQTPMIDVHWGIQCTLDYYRNVFGYNSFDNKGTDVICFVNPPLAVFMGDNATAVPPVDGKPGMMMYGLGGTDSRPFVDLQTTGHEFTHLVARDLFNDLPDDEDCHSGALNESFADIMGMAIERTATGRETWIVSEDLPYTGEFIRRFDKPEECGDPSAYLGPLFDDKDYEVHTNAGVQNHMFYLLCTGGEGVNSLEQDYSVTAMDRTEAEYLAFKTLERHTFNTMSYKDAAEAWINCAMLEYGEGSPQQRSVIQAWAAVGIGDGDTAIEKIGEQLTRPATMRYNLMGQPQREAAGLVIEDGSIVLYQ